MQKSEAKVEKASGSGFKKVAAVILKKPKETRSKPKEDEETSKSDQKKGKLSGKSSDRKRTVADIRDQSTAE